MPHNHEELLKHVSADMPSDELLQDLGDLFKVFGDTTRIKIMYASRSCMHSMRTRCVSAL